MPVAVPPSNGNDGAAQPAATAPRRRRSRRRVGLLVLAGLALVVVAWTLVAGLLAAHRLREVRADVKRLTSQPGTDRARLERTLENDLRTVDGASALLRQPGPRLFGLVPVIGRNVDAERVVSEASAAALRAGLTLTRATDGLDNGQGGVDTARLRSAGTALADAAATLRDPLRRLATQSTGWSLPPVTTGVRQARDQLLGLDEKLRRGAAGLDGIAGVMGSSGRRTVLVGLLNNAELRGAGGLLSAYATGTIDNGRLTLRPFRDVNDVAQPPSKAKRVPSPPAYHAAYGRYLADTTLWKNVPMSAQDADTAQVLSAVAAASIKVNPNVVVLCDVPAASGIISATGNVTIEGESVSGDELTRRLLVDAYGKGSLSETKQNARRRALTTAASQAFDRLRSNATATPALLQALLDAVSGRHLVVWSDRPDEQQQLDAARVAGTVDATGKDIALPVTNNLGDSPTHGNKLDYYVERSLTMDVHLGQHEATVVQTLTLHNAAPTTLGPYVAGVRNPGQITELLSMDAAADASLTSFTHDGQAEDVDVDSADGGQRVTTVLVLPRGATATYRLSYRLPVHDGRYRLLLVPQALARPAQLRLHIVATDGSALGVTSGVAQPDGGDVQLTGAWDTVRDLTVPVHGLGGLRGVLHSIAHFWTHKVPV
jgi:hypothetical protein